MVGQKWHKRGKPLFTKRTAFFLFLARNSFFWKRKLVLIKKKKVRRGFSSSTPEVIEANRKWHIFQLTSSNSSGHTSRDAPAFLILTQKRPEIGRFWLIEMKTRRFFYRIAQRVFQKIQYSIFNIQYSTCNIQHSIFNIQYLYDIFFQRHHFLPK